MHAVPDAVGEAHTPLLLFDAEHAPALQESRHAAQIDKSHLETVGEPGTCKVHATTLNGLCSTC